MNSEHVPIDDLRELAEQWEDIDYEAVEDMGPTESARECEKTTGGYRRP